MSCLFQSLSAFTGESADGMRQKIVDYMRTNDKLLNDIRVCDAVGWESGQSLSAYLDQMKRSSTWGGAIEIAAFVCMTKTNVWVYNARDSRQGTTQIIRFSHPEATSKIDIQWQGGHYVPLK